MIMNITLQNAVEMIKNSHGKFFTVGFIKRHSLEMRQMNCQYMKEKKSEKKSKKDEGLLLVKTRDGFRSVNLSGLKWIKINGNMFRVN